MRIQQSQQSTPRKITQMMMRGAIITTLITIFLFDEQQSTVQSFTLTNPTTTTPHTCKSSSSSSSLHMISPGRSSSKYAQANERSKRQERVGHLIRTEVASVIQLGYPIKNTQSEIDDDLRRRISVVNADVSPDLRQARITVSIIKRTGKKSPSEDDDEASDEEFYDEKYSSEEHEEEDEDEEEYFDEEDEEFMYRDSLPANNSGDAIVDKRQAYAWLVKNTKQIRHSIAQRLSHMKTVPELTFVQADVGAAVDVMNLIDQVSKGNYKRDSLGLFGGNDDNLPEYMYLESEMDDDDDDWIDDDDDDDYDEEDEWEERRENAKWK